MKNTKGTWYAKDGQIYPEETGKTLALIPYFDKTNEEQQANSQLIAAAPEMLDALIEADKLIDGLNLQSQYANTVKDFITLAINKAKGTE